MPTETIIAAKDRAGRWWEWLPWAASGIGLFLVIFLTSDASAGTWGCLILPPGFIGCFALSVIVHECGHFLAAQGVGFKIQSVSIGRGKVILQKQFSWGALLLRPWPVSGRVAPSYTQERGMRWRVAAMVAAGPLSTAALLLAFGWYVRRFWIFGAPTKFIVFATEMTLANGLLLLDTLTPYQSNLNGRKVSSDALQLIQLALKRPVPGSWKWHVKNSPIEPLLDAQRKELEKPNLSEADRCQLLDAFATAVVMYGASEHLEEANRHAEELERLKPSEWTVKGTRGSLLVDSGQIDQGMAMLKEVMEKDPSAFDRAICACFLALGELKRNNLEAARKWQGEARKLDPDCGALGRVDAALLEAGR